MCPRRPAGGALAYWGLSGIVGSRQGADRLVILVGDAPYYGGGGSGGVCRKKLGVLCGPGGRSRVSGGGRVAGSRGVGLALRAVLWFLTSASAGGPPPPTRGGAMGSEGAGGWGGGVVRRSGVGGRGSHRDGVVEWAQMWNEVSGWGVVCVAGWGGHFFKVNAAPGDGRLILCTGGGQEPRRVL